MTDSRNDIGAPYPQRKEQDHDPLCPVVATDLPQCPQCALIAKVRADERAKVRALVAAEPSWIADNDMVGVFIKDTVLALIDGSGS